MKKVLYVATVDIHIKTFHIPYLKMLKEKGYEVHVATNGNEKIDYCDVKHTICIERNPFKLKNLKAIKQLKKILEKEKFDFVHCHTPMGSVVTRLAARKVRRKGTKVFYTAHGFHFYKGAPLINWLLYYSIEKWLSKYTDKLITINEEDYELAKKKFKRTRVEYIPGVGIDLQKFNIHITEKEKNCLRQKLGLLKTDFILTCVARLDKNKNQIFLINVLEKIVKKHKSIHLLLVGGDELNGYYQKIVKEKKLEHNIHFLGKRNDIPQLLSITNVVLSASKREGLPVNVMEAFACGLPVIALNCRGMKDLVENGTNGYVIDSNSKDSDVKFYRSILKLFSHFNKCQKMQQCNIKKAEMYDINLIKKMYEKIYFESKLKILHLLNTNKFSGAENVVCTIIKNFGNKYDMCYCSPQGTIVDKLTEENIKYCPIKKLSYFEIRKTVKQLKPDIIHAHDNRATVIASFFVKKAKVISHIHGNNKIMNSLNLKTMLFNFCSKKVDKIIWVSDSSYDGYYFKKNVKNKSVILYNVIDDKDIIKKSQLYECSKKYDLIFLGRLGYPKNPARLIEIIKLIREKKKNISVAIVGDGQDKKNVENLINSYNLTKNISLYGFQTNPYPILKNSKILIMTSIYEGTPMCALEALSLGKPIVATPVDGLKKVVVSNKNGYLSNSNGSLCNYIVNVLNNKKLYNDISKNARLVFDNFNDISKYLDLLEDIYFSR